MNAVPTLPRGAPGSSLEHAGLTPSSRVRCVSPVDVRGSCAPPGCPSTGGAPARSEPAPASHRLPPTACRSGPVAGVRHTGRLRCRPHTEMSPPDGPAPTRSRQNPRRAPSGAAPASHLPPPRQRAVRRVRRGNSAGDVPTTRPACGCRVSHRRWWHIDRRSRSHTPRRPPNSVGRAVVVSPSPSPAVRGLVMSRPHGRVQVGGGHVGGS